MTVSENVLAAMRKTNEKFNTTVLAAKKVDKLDEIYTRDARILPPGSDMVTGLDQIRAFWQLAIGGIGLRSAKLFTLDAQLQGDSVFEIGRVELKAGDGRSATAKYVVLWKQEDGAWKWHVQIWNRKG